MTKVYITFGQNHAHRVSGKTLDCDSIAVINCTDYSDGRKQAFELFDGKFHMCYAEEDWQVKGQEWLDEYYPRGLIEV